MKNDRITYLTDILKDRTYFNRKKQSIRSYSRIRYSADKLPQPRSFYSSFRGFLISDESKGFLSQLFAVLVLVFLTITIIRVGRGANIYDSMPTFEGFLNTVCNAPVISPVFDVIPTNLGIWVIEIGDFSISFDFLRIFVESFLSILNFLLWLVQNLFLVVEYLFYFLKWALQIG